jgi:hypothetical protein
MESSEAGKPLYEKFGFKSVRPINFDVTPWGYSEFKVDTVSDFLFLKRYGSEFCIDHGSGTASCSGMSSIS